MQDFFDGDRRRESNTNNKKRITRTKRVIREKTREMPAYFPRLR